MSYPEGQYGGGKLARVLAVLGASFPLGRILGVRLRMYWLGAILVPLIITLELGQLVPAGDAVLAGLMVTVILFGTILLHELGHVMAGRRYHIVTPLITLSPMGGLAHMDAAAPTPKADIFIAAAGPATHLVGFGVAFGLSLLVEGAERPSWLLVLAVDTLWRLNLWLLVFNLLPFWPMDGGRILRSALAMRMHPNRATIIAGKVGYVGAGLFVVAAIVMGGLWSTILLAIAITNFFECRRAIRTARWSAGPYAREPRQPWEADPDAWKGGGGGGASTGDPSPRGGGRRAAREEKKRAEAARRRARLQEDVDRILERVNEVGMSGLTARERATLMRASEAARRDRH